MQGARILRSTPRLATLYQCARRFLKEKEKFNRVVTRFNISEMIRDGKYTPVMADQPIMAY
jgi:hypothetical protein